MNDYPPVEIPPEDAQEALPEEPLAEAEGMEVSLSQPEEPAEPIDLNTATKTQLVSLPHIGRTLAQRIIEARPVRALEDLADIRGISPAAIEDLRPLVTISPPDTPEEETPAEELPSEPEEPETAEALPTLRATDALESLEEELLEAAEPEEEAAPEEPAEAEAAEELESLEEAVLGQEDTEDLGPIPAPPQPDEASGAPEEPSHPAEEPPPQPAPPAQGGVSRSQAWGLAFVSSLVTLVLAIIFSLAVLAGINGGLRYAGPEDIRQVARQVEGVNQRIDALQRDADGLRSRLDNLESLSGRVDNLERQSDTIRGAVDGLEEGLSSMESDLGALDESVTSLQTRVDELIQEQDAFQSFFQKLGSLIDEFFAPEGQEGAEAPPPEALTPTPTLNPLTPTLTPTATPAP